MSIVDNYSGSQNVTCGIGYQHRDQDSQSGWQYNNTWATIFSARGDGENCEGAGCGMQARLYCEGPPAGFNSGNFPTFGENDGQCGTANANIYAGGSNGMSGFYPLPADRCAAGAESGYTYNQGDQFTPGFWSWSCLGTSGGQNDSCAAYNSQDNWNPLGDPDFGTDGCSGSDPGNGTIFLEDPGDGFC
jgi:hypothetical protein